MKPKTRSVLSWILCLILIWGCIPTQTAHAGVTIFTWMANNAPGETITIMWYQDVEGADHYDCTVRLDGTDIYPRPRSTSDTGYDCHVVAPTAGRYKIWVGAVDANGNDITSSITYVTVNEASDECEEHDWNDETGTCKLCGEECPHNNGVYKIEHEPEEGRSLSDTEHEIVWIYDEECKICRYIIEANLTSTEIKEHSFDSNGDCTLCDYRAACKHEEKTTALVDTNYEQHTSEEHIVKTVASTVCANPNCGKEIAFGDVITSEYEAHTMQNDVCIYCNYAVEYQPVEVTLSNGQSSAYVGDTITASCTVSGGTGDYIYYWYVYLDGSEVYNTSSWDKRGSYSATQEGTYSFSVQVTDRNNDDTASDSGSGITVSKAPCLHPDTSDVQTGDPQYTKLSDSKHTVRFDMERVCNDCGSTTDSWYTEATEDHSYADGNCIHCGSAEPSPEPEACTHPSMTSTEFSRSRRSTTSKEEHLVDITWEDRCSTCNQLLNNTRTTTEYENHTYDGLTCTLCGYIAECPHTNTEPVKLDGYPVYTKDSDSQHIVDIQYKTRCSDCGDDVEALTDSARKYYREDHTFNDNNTCSRCGFVKKEAQQALSVTASANQTTAYVGDSISASVTVSGGSGSYSIGWTVSKDGTVVAQSDMSTGAKYNHSATETGSYVFTATVKDSDGNTKTVSTGAITVKKAHNWETITDTSYANLTDDGHDQVTTSHKKCTICGETTEATSTTVTQQHESDYKDYWSKHPHQLYSHCKYCGHKTPLPHHKTANGKIQEPDVCCICHDHKWSGEAVNEDGEWREYCKNCGSFQEAAPPEIPTSTPASTVPPCTTHTWGDTFYSIDDREAMHVCKTCKQLEIVHETKADEYTAYLELKDDLGEGYGAYWYVIAQNANNFLASGSGRLGEAIAALPQGAGYIYSNMSDKAKELMTGMDTRTQIKVNTWKDIIQSIPPTTTEDYMTTASNTLDLVQFFTDPVISESLSKATAFRDSQQLVVTDLQSTIDIYVSGVDISDDALNAAVVADSNLKSAVSNLKAANTALENTKGIEQISKALPYLFAGIKAIAEGSESSAKVDELNKAYDAMSKDYANNAYRLTSIIADAQAIGNIELECAAKIILDETSEKYYANIHETATALSAILDFHGDKAESKAAYTVKAVDSALESLTSFVVNSIGVPKGSISPLTIIQVSAWVASLTTNADEVAAQCEIMSILMEMSSSTNQTNFYMFKNDTADGSHTAELWAKLQQLGDDEAKKLTDLLNEESWLNVFSPGANTLKQFGINTDKETVKNLLDSEKQLFQHYLNEIRAN